MDSSGFLAGLGREVLVSMTHLREEQEERARKAGAGWRPKVASEASQYPGVVSAEGTKVLHLAALFTKPQHWTVPNGHHSGHKYTMTNQDLPPGKLSGELEGGLIDRPGIW